jgi:hypothetical protein
MKQANANSFEAYFGPAIYTYTRAQAGAVRIPVALYVRNSDKHPARLMTLRATAGAVDVDDPAPAITVMLPDED